MKRWRPDAVSTESQNIGFDGAGKSFTSGTGTHVHPTTGVFRGTSNPYLGMRHDLTSNGTTAHELTMAFQALYGLEMCNQKTMDHWIEEYRGSLGIALTDTVTTPVFLRSFDRYYAKLYDGCRQDSGDPKKIGDMIIAHYKSLDIDPMSKILVLSDALTTDKAINLHNYFLGRIKTTMGIGTHLSNDVGWLASNHVIKLVEIDFGHGFRPLLKLSDDVGKIVGGKRFAIDGMRQLHIPLSKEQAEEEISRSAIIGSFVN